MVHIYTDSTADLSPELIERFKIHIIPLYVYLNDAVYTDGVNVTNADLFQSVETTGQLPKTAAPAVGDFIRHFSEPGEYIYIGISSQLSATHQNALLARENCDPPISGSQRIFVIDSKNLSTGIGLLVLRAAELRDQGLPAAEIARQIEASISKVHTSFTIETLDYLYKGGRCSAMQNLMSGLLHIRPVIAVRPDGTLGVKNKTRGTRHKALQFMLDDFAEQVKQVDLHRVFVTHTGCDADAEYLRSELLKIAPIEEVAITIAGSVVASHCGPDTIGILFFEK